MGNKKRLSIIVLVLGIALVLSFSFASAQRYNEAPMLAAMVKAGNLPPVEQRLPKEPLVVTPIDGIGKYGGTLRHADGDSRYAWSTVTLRTSGLFRYNFANSEVILDMAKSYNFTRDLKTLTIELREGHKWSDGAPFTTDDIIFWWEDFILNEELTPAVPAFWRPGGEPAVFKKISPTKFSITFAVPYPVVIDRMGRPRYSSDPWTILPKHWIKKWHIKYNSKANELAKEEGFEKWSEAFQKHKTQIGQIFEPGRPMLWIWVPERRSANRFVAVRNPYFHQVDTAGNQLPYIDRVEIELTESKDIIGLKASSGELDFETYYLDFKDMPVYKQGEAKGNYRTLMNGSLRTTVAGMALNRTTKDPVLRDLFNKLDYRIAMSIAINRNAINEAIYFGLAKPYQWTVHPGMSFFKKEWATAHTEYDPGRANRMFDSLGLTNKDRDGFRLRSDGKGRISMLVEIHVPVEGAKIEIMEMVKADLEKVGLEIIIKTVDTAVLNQKNLNNETEIIVTHAGRGTLYGRANPNNIAFQTPQWNNWASQWTKWIISDGKDGIEPPAEIKRQNDLFNQFLQTAPGTREYDRLGEQYFDYFATQLPIIGTVGLNPRPLVVSNRLHNVPEEGITWGSANHFYGPFLPSQWYIDE